MLSRGYIKDEMLEVDEENDQECLYRYLVNLHSYKSSFLVI